MVEVTLPESGITFGTSVLTTGLAQTVETVLKRNAVLGVPLPHKLLAFILQKYSVPSAKGDGNEKLVAVMLVADCTRLAKLELVATSKL